MTLQDPALIYIRCGRFLHPPSRFTTAMRVEEVNDGPGETTRGEAELEGGQAQVKED